MSFRKVKVVVDSTSYIPKETLIENDISVVSLNVLLNGKSYREVDLENEFFYKEMNESKEIPKSSQPSVEEIKEVFTNIAKSGFDIVGIFISSKMSGTYSTAHLVREMVLEEYPETRIELVDSESNCMQMGFSAIQAARAAKRGENIERVVEEAKKVINTSKFLFVPDTLKYLKKGGRIGGASALFGTILQIKPILTVQNGETSVYEKVRTKKKAVEVILKKVLDDVTEKGLGEVIVHHINCEEEGLDLAKRLENELKIPVKIQSIGATIGLHVGPGSIGVAYYTKK
ncbi:MAG: DegV family protein [Clostridium sp.]|nr:DegV family protein [Clostridium sp.]MCI7441669.1 DegV family protein [Clostridium sp.]